MGAWTESLDVTAPGLLASTYWVRVTNGLCALGILLALAGALGHFLAWRRRAAEGESADVRGYLLPSRATLLVVFASALTLLTSIGNRWVEVNHFPSQTMSEVLVMFTFSLLLSMGVLHFAMGLTRMGHAWAILNDFVTLAVFFAAWKVHVHVTTLSTAQRDLPPALQSYWFPFHLSALMIGYATLTIAAILCLLFFAMRFWAGLSSSERRPMAVQALAVVGVVAVWGGALLGFQRLYASLDLGLAAELALTIGSVGAVVAVSVAYLRRHAGFAFRSGAPMSQLLLLAMLAVTPFLSGAGVYVAWLWVIVFGLGGLIALGMHRALAGSASGSVAELMEGAEKSMDQVSFRAFAVGFPFLTGGLWMGAFWAQEAWANYWGWDSKENSALITWLIYVVYVHLRMLGGYRGEKAMGVLLGGALSILITFQLFGYLPDSQKSLHRYTDDGVEPREGQIGVSPEATESARLDAAPAEAARAGAVAGEVQR